MACRNVLRGAPRRDTRDLAAERAGQFCHPEKDDDHNAPTSTPEARPTGAARNEQQRGEPHPHADVQPGIAVTAAARRKRHQTYPELEHARRCRLVVVGLEVGGRFGAETVQLHTAAAPPCTTPGRCRPCALAALRNCRLDLALVWAPGCRLPARLRGLAPRAAACRRARRGSPTRAARGLGRLSRRPAVGSRLLVNVRRRGWDSSRCRQKARKKKNVVATAQTKLKHSEVLNYTPGHTAR